jgi:hypothetical protein
MEADDEGWVTVTKSTKKKVLMEAELLNDSILIYKYIYTKLKTVDFIDDSVRPIRLIFYFDLYANGFYSVSWVIYSNICFLTEIWALGRKKNLLVFYYHCVAGRKGQEDRRREVDRRSARQKEPEKEKEDDPAEELLLLPGQGGQDDAHQGTPTQIRGGQVENCQNEGRTKVQTFLRHTLSLFLSCIKFKPFLIFFQT